jgi:hypothetical protein
VAQGVRETAAARARAATPAMRGRPTEVSSARTRPMVKSALRRGDCARTAADRPASVRHSEIQAPGSASVTAHPASKTVGAVTCRVAAETSPDRSVRADRTPRCGCASVIRPRLGAELRLTSEIEGGVAGGPASGCKSVQDLPLQRCRAAPRIALSYRVCYQSLVAKRTKRSVSLAPELALAIDRAAAERGETFSGWLAATASHRLRLEAGRRGLAAWEKDHGVLTAAELADGRARARAVLGVRRPEQKRRSA